MLGTSARVPYGADRSPRHRGYSIMTAASTAPIASIADRTAAGVKIRDSAPPAVLGSWSPPSDRADPIGLLEEQADDPPAGSRAGPLRPDVRLALHLLSRRRPADGRGPRRRHRARASPSSSAATRTCRTSGCSHRRSATCSSTSTTSTRRCPGPFEFDLKRLATSLVVAGREIGVIGHDARHMVHRAIRSYRERMAGYATMRGDRRLLRARGCDRDPRLRRQAMPAR